MAILAKISLIKLFLLPIVSEFQQGPIFNFSYDQIFNQLQASYECAIFSSQMNEQSMTKLCSGAHDL